MAQTPAAVQAQLNAATNGMNAQILIADEGGGGTEQRWYVMALADAPGRTRWCVTTAANTAAQQATAILAALRV